MYGPRSIFSVPNGVVGWHALSLRRAWFCAARPSKTQGVPPGRRQGGLFLEVLEDRILLSTWVPKGPAPIVNGQTPGNDPVSGRIAALAADLNDPNLIYLAAAGGGVWKTTD